MESTGGTYVGPTNDRDPYETDTDQSIDGTSDNLEHSYQSQNRLFPCDFVNEGASIGLEEKLNCIPGEPDPGGFEWGPALESDEVDID